MKHSGYHDDKITGRIDIQDTTNIKNAVDTTNKLRSIIDYTEAISDDKIDTGGITDDTHTLALIILTLDVLFDTQTLGLLLKIKTTMVGDHRYRWRASLDIEKIHISFFKIPYFLFLIINF